MKQAQQSESQVLALQNSLTQLDSVLTARLECDLTADDLPHDFKVWSQMSGFLITRKEHCFFWACVFVLSMPSIFRMFLSKLKNIKWQNFFY